MASETAALTREKELPNMPHLQKLWTKYNSSKRIEMALLKIMDSQKFWSRALRKMLLCTLLLEITPFQMLMTICLRGSRRRKMET